MVISANNNYIFTKKQTNKKNLFIINFHNSLLPKYRGRNAQMWAIFNKEEKTGISWHIVNSNIDDGALLYQKEVLIDKQTTSIELTKTLITEGIKIFKEHIKDILYLNIKPQKQAYLGHEIYKSTDFPNDGFLDLSENMENINSFLHSMDFGKIRIVPYPKIKIFGNEYEIVKYEIKENMLCLYFMDVLCKISIEKTI